MRARFGVTGPLVLVGLLAAAVALGPAAEPASAVKLTFIGDSKAAAINYSTKAKRLLARGHDAHRDLKVCRRLVRPSCWTSWDGTPLSALEVIQRRGTRLGTVLVIDVGYNDSSGTYRRELNQVMQAALDNGVRGVVWVNLKAVRPDFGRINSIINRARNRWPELYVANWNKYSNGHPGWFPPRSDGIHLTGAGAVGLVRLVRRYIPLAAQGPSEAVAAVSTSETPTPAEAPAVTEAESAAAEQTANSPAVGSNLGGDGDSTGLGDILPFTAGAALMLFLIFVTVKRRGAAPSS